MTASVVRSPSYESGMGRFVARIRQLLPEGRPLPPEVWRRRHRGILILLWIHAFVIAAWALIAGFSLAHMAIESGVVAAAALLASWRRPSRPFRASIASLGLITASAVLVHLSGGYIEIHFHFFVMLAVITLYQDWRPFLFAVAYVALHHGVVGMVDPASVYNHPDAWANPWKWAAIHGGFVLAASVAGILNWRLNETAHARSELILASAGDGIYGVKPDGGIAFVNPAAASMLGWSVDGLLDSQERAIVDEGPALRLLSEQANSGAVEESGDAVLRRKDGTTFPAEYVTSLIRDRDAITGAVVAFKDITSRRAGERERETLVETLAAERARLELVLADLQRAQSQIIEQERLHALGEMASGIAHDFNNALAPILGYTELLIMQPDRWDDRQRMTTYLERINLAAQDAASVIARLREFYRRHDGEAEDAFISIELPRLVEQVVAMTQPRWKDQALMSGRRIHVQTDLEQVPPILGSEAEIREALTNLIFNAVDALPGGGTITVRTRRAVEAVLLEVTDTGIGMPEDVRRRCLEPFFSTKGEHGTGLGLPMVYGIVQRHNGELDIVSYPGSGTTMQIRLPVATQDVQDVQVSDGPTRPLRVLAVDDDREIRELMVELLEHDGHTVVTTAEARDALTRVLAGNFDLVLTDRAMPGITGDQLAAAIKKSRPTMPIIMVTGFGDLMQASGELPEGVDRVISKPVRLLTLRQAMHEVLASYVATETLAPS